MLKRFFAAATASLIVAIGLWASPPAPAKAATPEVNTSFLGSVAIEGSVDLEVQTGARRFAMHIVEEIAGRAANLSCPRRDGSPREKNQRNDDGYASGDDGVFC